MAGIFYLALSGYDDPVRPMDHGRLSYPYIWGLNRDERVLWLDWVGVGVDVGIIWVFDWFWFC